VKTYSLNHPGISLTTNSNGVVPIGAVEVAAPGPWHPLQVTVAPGGVDSNLAVVEQPAKTITKALIIANFFIFCSQKIYREKHQSYSDAVITT
jgi:alpha-D-ribose 1-methylphosphonate 5-phosphate C-P lyase